jgi:hypothetical protein
VIELAVKRGADASPPSQAARQRDAPVQLEKNGVSVVPLKRKVIALGCDALRIEVSLLLFGEVAPRGGIRGPSSLVGAEGSTKTAREDVLD